MTRAANRLAEALRIFINAEEHPDTCAEIEFADFDGTRRCVIVDWGLVRGSSGDHANPCMWPSCPCPHPKVPPPVKYAPGIAPPSLVREDGEP